MNEAKFDFTYFFETLVQQVLKVAMNLPALYTSLFTVFILALIGQSDNRIILYAAVVLGFVLKLIFTITSNTKELKREGVMIVADIGAALGIVLVAGFVIEWILVGLTVVYLLYYSYIMTISYTRLGHNTEELLHDLRHRHDKASSTPKKPSKSTKKR